MKPGKIILHSAAFLITAGSILAFKVHKHTGTHRLYGATRSGSLNCTLATCFTSLAGKHYGKCHTIRGVKTAFIGPAFTLWTDVTRINLLKCSGATRHWTHSN